MGWKTFRQYTRRSRTENWWNRWYENTPSYVLSPIPQPFVYTSLTYRKVLLEEPLTDWRRPYRFVWRNTTRMLMAGTEMVFWESLNERTFGIHKLNRWNECWESEGELYDTLKMSHLSWRNLCIIELNYLTEYYLHYHQDRFFLVLCEKPSKPPRPFFLVVFFFGFSIITSILFFTWYYMFTFPHPRQFFLGGFSLWKKVENIFKMMLSFSSEFCKRYIERT